METRKIEFAKLKLAYTTVKNFLDSETEGYEPINSLETKVKDDIGLSGDDNLELLQKFVTKFELDHKDFNYNEHFHSEDELYGSGAALQNLLTLSVWLPLKTIQLITFNKIKIETPNFNKPERTVTDLTFRDLLIWYIEKEFKPSNTIQYEIKLNSENQ